MNKENKQLLSMIDNINECVVVSEMDVLFAMVDDYTKQNMLMEYCESFVQEGFKDTMKHIGGKIKKIMDSLVTKFLSIIASIRNMVADFFIKIAEKLRVKAKNNENGGNSSSKATTIDDGYEDDYNTDEHGFSNDVYKKNREVYDHLCQILKENRPGYSSVLQIEGNHIVLRSYLYDKQQGYGHNKFVEAYVEAIDKCVQIFRKTDEAVEDANAKREDGKAIEVASDGVAYIDVNLCDEIESYAKELHEATEKVTREELTTVTHVVIDPEKDFVINILLNEVDNIIEFDKYVSFRRNTIEFEENAQKYKEVKSIFANDFRTLLKYIYEIQREMQRIKNVIIETGVLKIYDIER